MGREVKRVALDFDWPLHKVWKGYLNDRPSANGCKVCNGNGYSPEAKRLYDQWYGYAPFDPTETGSVPLTVDDPAVRHFATRNTFQSYFTALHGWDEGIKRYWEFAKEQKEKAFLEEHPLFEINITIEAKRLIEMWNRQWNHHLNQDDVNALVAAGRLMDFTCRPRNQEQLEQLKKQAEAGGSDYWLKDGNGYVPTAKEVNDWNILSFGHDSINCHVCIKAKCKRLKLPLHCKTCNGKGYIWQSRKAAAYHNAWRKTEPPAGEGWQIWETVSEGSPITPVFATPEELATYMAKPGQDTSVTKGTSYNQWMAFIKAGWSVSFVGDEHGLRPGVQAVQEVTP